MSKFFNNFINDGSKKRNKFNTNYFYIGTILIILSFFVCFWLKTHENVYGDTNNLWNMFFISYRHNDISHIAYNCVMFLMSSIILERHFGSFIYVMMCGILLPLANVVCFATVSYLNPLIITGGWYGIGASCFTYLMFGLSIIVVLFNFKQYVWSKCVFATVITLAVNVVLASVNLLEASTFELFFKNPNLKFMQALFIPTSGHLAPFIAGGCIGLLIVLLTKIAHIEKKNG